MQTILIVAATLIAALLIILAVPGAFFAIAMYKATRAGKCSTPDKLRWMADQIEGVETVEVKERGYEVHAL